MDQGKEISVEEKVKEILAKYTKKNPITLSASLDDELGLTSFDYVEILFDLEDQLGIEIPEDGVAEAKTVEDVVKYLTELTQS